MTSRLRDTIKLVVAVVAPLAVGGIGGLVTAPAIPTWYAALNKPAWNPPAWAFGPAWTILYILMGVAAWLVWRRGWDTPGVPNALGFFAAQLVLNGLWTWIFFGFRSPGLAFAEIALLWCLILLTTIRFFSLNSLGGVLLLPYLLWVSFAGVLNGAIWFMNR